ncbi:MAG: hypothetical protein IPO81_08170 [Kouleothrix sp.]|nr:hypothetical protein [Kouleothrix sp.]
MSLSANDDFLDVIAHQARVTYASQQLHTSRDALQEFLTRSVAELDDADSPRMRHELAYYTQQVERWREYLERLRGLGSL